jgi:hypothetical protein
MERTNAQMIEDLQRLLRDAQWSGAPVKTPQHRMEPTCPKCHCWSAHSATCELAAALEWKPVAELEPDLEPEPTAQELGAAVRDLGLAGD